jgi:hypothetical protein
MKTGFKTMLIAALSATLLGGCKTTYQDPGDEDSQAPSRFTMDTIILLATGNPTTLEVQNAANAKCMGNQNQNKGCILVPQGNVGLAEFVLRGKWQDYDFTKMWICEGDKPENWTPQACELDAPLNDEFEVFSVAGTASASTQGVLDLGGVDQYYLINKNRTPGTYYYVVEACPEEEGDCIRLDPRLRNGGITF